jgi:prepilin-type processing-associated H-X9-DG protein
MVIRIPRFAYTLIELIVIIAILAVLIGLLLPAVQKVRGAAARMQCGSNLKQIALAAHLYHDGHDKFPPGTRADKSEAYPELNWSVRLLPYVEQDAAWNEVVADYQRDRDPFTASPPHTNKARVFKTFSCPADWRTSTAWTVTNFGTSRVSLLSYLGNSGTGTGTKDGVISNTLLFLERPPSADLWYGWFYDGVGQDGHGALDSVIGARERNVLTPPRYRSCGNGPFPFQNARIDDICSLLHSWSLHTGGANVAFADGSVRFLSYSADSILPALSSRAGGETVSLPN